MIDLSEQVTEHGVDVVHLKAEEQNILDFSSSPGIKLDYSSMIRTEKLWIISVQFKFSFHWQQFLTSLTCIKRRMEIDSSERPPPDISVVWRHKHSRTHACTYTQFGNVCQSCKNR